MFLIDSDNMAFLSTSEYIRKAKISNCTNLCYKCILRPVKFDV